MPATANEATRILQIAGEYLSEEDMIELFARLDSAVGARTDNDSLKATLAMFRQFTDQPPVVPASPRAGRVTVYAMVLFHAVVITANIAAFFLLPFLAPWYVALPCCSSVFYLGLSRHGECPLTAYENKLRRRAGMPAITGFVGHYMLRPTRRFLRGARKRTSACCPETMPSKVAG